jgi:hypothetical protein
MTRFQVYCPGFWTPVLATLRRDGRGRGPDRGLHLIGFGVGVASVEGKPKENQKRGKT